MTNAAVSSKSLESAKPLTRALVAPLEAPLHDESGAPLQESADAGADLEAASDRRQSQPVPRGSRGSDWSQPRVAAILEAAASCFSKRGFGATTLAEIGRELGLRKSIVHYYFASKTALVHEVQRFVMHRFLTTVREALVADGSPTERARSAFRALYRVSTDDETASGLSVEVWSARRRDPELHGQAAALDDEKRALVSSTLATVLELNAEDPQLDAVVTLALATLDGLVVARQTGDDAAARAERAFELLLRLLEPELVALRSPASAASPAAS